MKAKIVAFFTSIWTFIKLVWTKVKGIYTRFENLLEHVWNHIHAFVDEFITMIRKSLVGPEKFLVIIVAMVLVVDLVVMGKIGIIKYVIDTITLLLGLLTTNLWGTIILATSVIVIFIASKFFKKV